MQYIYIYIYVSSWSFRQRQEIWDHPSFNSLLSSSFPLFSSLILLVFFFLFSFKFVIFFLFIQFLFNIKILFIYWDVGAMAQDPGSDCDFVGSCKNKADCAKPCGAKGHSPTAVLCVPNPNGGKRCCCIIA